MLLGKKLLVCVSVGLLFFTSEKTQKIKILDNEAIINLHLASKDITGSVSGLSSEVVFDPENLQKSSVNATVLTETISTGNLVRDIKLVSKRYLYKKKFEKITFKSNRIIEVRPGYLIEGDLTIKDVTKSMVFDVVYSEGVIAGVGSINLLDFGIALYEKRNESKLDIYLELRVVKEDLVINEN